MGNWMWRLFEQMSYAFPKNDGLFATNRGLNCPEHVGISAYSLSIWFGGIFRNVGLTWFSIDKWGCTISKNNSGLLLYWFTIRRLKGVKIGVEPVTNPENHKQEDFAFPREVISKYTS